MRVYVIRHAPREPSDDFTDAEEGDPEAELTEDGQETARRVGEWMAENDEIPTVLLVSPTVRTQQTAEAIVKAIEGIGYVAPDIKTDVSIGPYMSIRGLIQQLGESDQRRVGIVSHSQTIKNGLKALNVDNDEEGGIDLPAAGELRILKIKRKSGRWREEKRVRPSDLGGSDVY